MLQGVSQAQRRRKHTTYGKTPRKPGNEFSYDLDDYFSDPKSPETPSVEPRALHSPVRLSKASHASKPRDSNEHLFDVPTSDDDADSRSSVKSAPSRKTPSVRSTPKPTKKVATQLQPSPPKPQHAPPQPQPPVPNTNGVKRKRTNAKTSQSRPKSNALKSRHADKRLPRSEFDVPASPPRSEASPAKSASATPKASKSRKLVSVRNNGALTQASLLPDPSVPHLKPVTQEIRSPSTSPTSPRPSASDPPSTPVRQIHEAASPGTQTSVFSTPRQRRLWDDLIGNELCVQPLTKSDPYGDQSVDATVTDSSNRPDQSVSLDLPRPMNLPSVNIVEQMGSKKKRLIDRLAPSASPSDASSDASSESEDPESEASGSERDAMDVDVPMHSQSSVNQTGASSLQSSSQPSSNLKFTYAGQRSYLKAPVNDMDDLLSQPLDLDTSTLVLPSRSNNTSFHNPANVEAGANSFDEEDDSQSVRNIHELRAAGDANRFAEEMEVILSEVANGRNFGSKSSLSSRRNAWLELSEKLIDKPFRERFLQHGYDQRAFTRAKDEVDPVIGFVIASAISLLLESGYNTEAANNLLSIGVKSLLIKLLESTRDIALVAKDRTSNMSKVAQSALVEFGKVVVSAPVWGDMTPKSSSPCTMSLKALESLVRRSRESGNVIHVLDTALLDKLLALLTDRAASFTRIFEPVNQDVVTQSGLVISILESSTISSECSSNTGLWSRKRLQELVTCLDAVLSSPNTLPNQLQNLVFRLCVNLANNNEQNSEYFSTRSFIGKILASIRLGFEQFDNEIDEAEGSSAALDTLILSLGAAINLAECSDAARKTTMEANQEDTDRLLDGFVKSRNSADQADSLAKSRANVPYGYLAVLLANLCQNSSARANIQRHLPDNQLKTLIDAVEEFIAFHKAADQSAKGNEVWVAFTERLQRIADALKESAAASA